MQNLNNIQIYMSLQFINIYTLDNNTVKIKISPILFQSKQPSQKLVTI